MVTSTRTLVQKIQDYVCTEDNPDLNKIAEKLGVPLEFAQRCTETEDVEELDRLLSTYRQQQPKQSKPSRRPIKQATVKGTNGHTPSVPYQAQLSEVLPVDQTPPTPQPQPPADSLEATVEASATPQSDTENLETVTGRPGPYTPANVRNIPTKREAKYIPPKDPLSQVDLPVLQAIVGTIPAENFRAQMFGKLERLYTRLEDSLRLWRGENYEGIFRIHDERQPSEQEEKRTASLLIGRLASSLGVNLELYERTLQHNDDRLSERVRSDNLAYLASMKDALERMRELQEEALEATLLSRAELVRE
ncbi:MAG: hypothetical protein Q8L34_00430 [Candidatus Woesearchaeota archaeon]|nr:hypothetical protein [Candidatus Woesearchaeota archaeon]